MFVNVPFNKCHILILNIVSASRIDCIEVAGVNFQVRIECAKSI